ncbi:MAG: hypothetical protein ABIT08_02565 [Bacteroidia bacterium]
MKTKKLIPHSLLSMAIAALIITGCKKNDTTVEDYTADSAGMYDQSVADMSYDDAGNVADEGVEARTSATPIPEENLIQTSCATVTIDTMVNPHTAAIIFSGTTQNPCLGKDGNYRSGEIDITWTGRYRDAGSTHTITFNNYYLNFNKIEGTKTVTNNGYNTAGHLTFSISVNGTVTIDPQYSYNGTGGTITYTSTRNREWIAGETTWQWNDDIYLIDGTASGTTTTGAAFSMSTAASSPLRKEIGFPHFTSGILNITLSGKPDRIIDYSYLNGAKDDLARVTVNGHTFTIKLGRKLH